MLRCMAPPLMMPCRARLMPLTDTRLRQLLIRCRHAIFTMMPPSPLDAAISMMFDADVSLIPLPIFPPDFHATFRYAIRYRCCRHALFRLMPMRFSDDIIPPRFTAPR